MFSCSTSCIGSVYFLAYTFINACMQQKKKTREREREDKRLVLSLYYALKPQYTQGDQTKMSCHQR